MLASPQDLGGRRTLALRSTPALRINGHRLDVFFRVESAGFTNRQLVLALAVVLVQLGL